MSLAKTSITLQSRTNDLHIDIPYTQLPASISEALRPYATPSRSQNSIRVKSIFHRLVELEQSLIVPAVCPRDLILEQKEC